jgi:hypothetical protein
VHDRESAQCAGVCDPDAAEVLSAAFGAAAAPVEVPRLAVRAFIRDEIRPVVEHQIVHKRDGVHDPPLFGNEDALRIRIDAR